MELNKTEIKFDELLNVKQVLRDEKWEENFLQILPNQKLVLINDQPQNGPDGWPYLLTKIETADLKSPVESESFLNLNSWLSEKGIGLVINPQKNYPDYVFTYGMLWYFKFNGKFLEKNASISKENLDNPLDLSAQHWSGDPSESFLPTSVRKILKQFFMDQGVLDLKVGMLSSDQTNFDLCFSIESLGNPPKKEWKGILEAISWFLPAHYSLRLLSEKQFKIFKSL